MSEENQMNEGQREAEAAEQDSGPRNDANAKAAERIGRKAERRAERKLPTSGSEDSVHALEEQNSTPDSADDE